VDRISHVEDEFKFSNSEISKAINILGDEKKTSRKIIAE
jgi:hypothetical protein